MVRSGRDGGNAGCAREVTITSPASIFDITTVFVPVGRPVTYRIETRVCRNCT